MRARELAATVRKIGHVVIPTPVLLPLGSHSLDRPERFIHRCELDNITLDLNLLDPKSVFVQFGFEVEFVIRKWRDLPGFLPLVGVKAGKDETCAGTEHERGAPDDRVRHAEVCHYHVERAEVTG